ncbi:Acyl-CoA synthetase (AMP-forming)/AMP-acid ligase II [Tistlia consotensis]|uniref:Acyl-CoA synthetase (AMP-forming)/AMP-acid ligase II n=1 Tax=Tistlia consotensis USBA 355 TaxID=560819 RepID=A0A1Y6BBE1_9PROT|nr:acyl--CoA ligase [Tistlia consotensis]SME92022.1 Acyl-CoA synthetase (AMP-forming)/AMP-acid ligase II [Tistlia consotensis USBA 355]SNR27742.1 Acyl-CoA synthetase (AMP-forming)/AMP-acid ligase II [Tistlia consotensis]
MTDLREAESLSALIAAGNGDAPALLAPDRPPTTRAGLARQIERIGGALAARGIGAGDRVAIVLANGPEMAAAFLGVAAHATAAPLNPAYRAEEFAFYLDDLGAKAIILAEGVDSPVRAVAAERGLPLLELSVPEGAAAGVFDLPGMAEAAAARPSGADDEALVLHTSGTTSRPKVVPLLQRNLLASARHIGDALWLGPADRCLNVMPLFHIHGLIAAVLSSLGAGGSVVCTPGFNALRFMAWLGESGATWYTAVPTMHQAILSRAERQPEAARGAGLRFVRSSSSSLPPQVMLALEETFGCPVIESYGMTEAAHQMTSNQLPPGQRKPGTVGVPSGPQVRVVDEAWESVPTGAVGEVVIKGPNVTPGYEANPKANAESFRDGWFRTGDQGTFDADGFLTITGRLKEIINRGGEKISPREVDEVLLDHPAVGQAVTFALPHPKLGEEVAAAIVLKEGQSADERALRDFAATRLADFKVPRKWVFLEEIPKGATGKLQRIGLAKQLGLAE